ncbi:MULTISPECIES: hypothetical protein [Actinokineospora]|uniref:Uncharacterized protein n=1 Tax=Actinokineospora fastidiosa TaxID=1816 RepID=A0A918LEV8_9PSEU|nr:MULTISPECIES: hypothetical protein [Actinokineospora]UVS80879.1 hypothetical protein Actkin_04631 [Actinokineospora sp. UTMC 2448]GGS37897.1 hypothetical protein GCM10010171_35990 [Actinokineospora fastidiosa]
MSAAAALSTLLDGLGEDRRQLRADPAVVGFVELVQAAIDAWDATLAAIEAGGDGSARLAEVSGLFAVGDDVLKQTRMAEEMVRLGVGTTHHRLQAGLVQVRRELVKANGPVVALVRRAAVLGRRAQSRWRGAQGREAAQVDRDLKLEEVRVAVKHLLEDLRALVDQVRRETRPV